VERFMALMSEQNKMVENRTTVIKGVQVF